MHKEKSNLVFSEHAVKRLLAAASIRQTVYVSGSPLYGKSTLVMETFKRRKYTYIDCTNLGWDDQIVMETGSDMLIIDNLHQLRDTNLRKDIINYIQDARIFVILISHADVPAWLLPMNMGEGLMKISEQHMCYSDKDIQALAKLKQVKLSDEEIARINKVCLGVPMTVNYYIQKVCEDCGVNERTDQIVLTEMTKYIETSLLPSFRVELLNFMVQLSIVDEFDIALATIISGNANAERLITELISMGSFMIQNDDKYAFKRLMLNALRLRAVRELPIAKKHQIEYNAGLYYEMTNQIVKAAGMYELCRNRDKVLEILEKNVMLNPGKGYYSELEYLYMSLTEEEVANRPALIYGMAMLNSMMLKPVESEVWYVKLKNLYENSKGALKKEAEIWLIHLKIALPHRTSSGIMELIKSLPVVVFQRGIKLPPFSVTSGLPSMMNGGLDFCEWSKKDKEIAKSVGWIIERFLEESGKGIVNTALAESYYEKGAECYDVMALISKAQMEIENGGCDDNYFVTVALQARINILQGNILMAISIIDTFIKRVEKTATKRLINNAKACRVRLALYDNDKQYVDEWMKRAPDENERFVVLDRYIYMTKVNVYILRGEYQSAYILLEKLIYYADVYERKMLWIEAQMMMSIVKSRMALDWQTNLLSALAAASEYSFTRKFSEKGFQITKLIEAASKEISAREDINLSFIETILAEGKRVGCYFPQFLESEVVKPPTLSENGLKVLIMQAEGKSRQEIADTLVVSLDNVKYHIKQNYKKLGVDNKTDAVIKAKELHII